MAHRCLLIVDVQKGFINAWTAGIPTRVEMLQSAFDHVIVARFQNPQGSMHRRLMDWHRFTPGTRDTELAFTPRPNALVMEKNTYTCYSAVIRSELRRINADTIHLCGIATDGCILKTAVDLFEAGLRPVVIADACASHGGPDCHNAGLMLLSRFIGDDQIVSATDLDTISAQPTQV